MILLTGGTGFLGGALLDTLKDKNIRYVGRQKPSQVSHSFFYQSEVNVDADFTSAVKNIDVIIHCAARSHIMEDKESNPLSAYREVNTHGTLKLAKQAAGAGVKRFIFLSSVKVNGEMTALAKPFTEMVSHPPFDPYGLSKYEAEIGLLDIANKTNMEVVIIRPPLIYGPNTPGNFAYLINIANKGYPLPLGSIKNNRRSLIALENLVDFILLCADYNKTPQAANQTFVISDGEDVSTAELFLRVARAYGKKNYLLPFPVPLLRLAAKLLGKQAMAYRLLGSLQVDSSKARELLGWKPVITMDEQLKKMAETDSGCG